MSPRERVLAALRLQGVDRPPVCNPTSVVAFELLDGAGATCRDACRSAETAARLAGAGCADLGFDTVMPVFSVVQESSALGCRIRWEDRAWPAVDTREPLWSGPGDVTIPGDLLDHPDLRCVLESIRLLRERSGGDVAIIGKAMGPWSLSYHCFGLENFLIMTAEAPEQAHACLRLLKEVTVSFAAAQVKAGADVICIPDHASGDLVSSRYYARFLREIHAEFARRIPAPLVLHICGRTIDRMNLIAETGFAGFHFDSKNDPEAAMAVVGGRMALIGCINNPEVLLRGTRDDVRREVFRSLDAGLPLIAPECAIPLDTPLENLREIPRAVRSRYAQT